MIRVPPDLSFSPKIGVKERLEKSLVGKVDWINHLDEINSEIGTIEKVG